MKNQQIETVKQATKLFLGPNIETTLQISKWKEQHFN